MTVFSYWMGMGCFAVAVATKRGGFVVSSSVSPPPPSLWPCAYRAYIVPATVLTRSISSKPHHQYKVNIIPLRLHGGNRCLGNLPCSYMAMPEIKTETMTSKSVVLTITVYSLWEPWWTSDKRFSTVWLWGNYITTLCPVFPGYTLF